MIRAYKLVCGCTVDSKTELYATMCAKYDAHQHSGCESDKDCHRCDVYCG
jgi:hypothetical protein